MYEVLTQSLPHRMCLVGNLTTSSYYCCKQNIICGKGRDILLLGIDEDFFEEEHPIRAQQGGISMRVGRQSSLYVFAGT